MNEHPDKIIISPFLVLGVGILAVSTASIFIRFAQQEAPSLVIGAFRLLIAALILAPFAVFRNRTELATLRRSTMVWISLGGLFLACHFAAWITSLEYTTVASSVVLVTTAPLWVAIFSPIFLKEKITRITLLGIFVALTGSLIVSLGNLCTVNERKLMCYSVGSLNNTRELWGDLLALAGAFLSAGYLIVGRKVRKTTSLITYSFLVYFIAAACMMVFMLFRKASLVGYSPYIYLIFFALAIIPQLLGHTSFNYALRYKSSALVSVALLGEPIGSVILAFFLLKETPTFAELTGGAIILAGIYLVSRSNGE
jgi:drug/metabolite transporter (DMT)-like permease